MGSDPIFFIFRPFLTRYHDINGKSYLVWWTDHFDIFFDRVQPPPSGRWLVLLNGYHTYRFGTKTKIVPYDVPIILMYFLSGSDINPVDKVYASSVSITLTGSALKQKLFRINFIHDLLHLGALVTAKICSIRPRDVDTHLEEVFFLFFFLFFWWIEILFVFVFLY